MEKLNNKNRYDFLRNFPKGGICAEIGVFRGDFSVHILGHLKPKKLHLIDVWRLAGPRWGGIPTDEIYRMVQNKYKSEIENNIVEMNEVKDQEFLKTLNDNYFDWVYIDSSHQYEHTKLELNILKDKVKPAGVIAGHDWRDNPNHKHYGVHKAVEEFCSESGYEIIFLDNHLQWAIKRKQV